jgi:hypothetical protein
MLSPAEYHKQVPKELAKNLKFRRYVIRECDADPERARAVVKMCEDDLLFYVNVFCWQSNPQLFGQEVGPFITWEYQDQALLQTIRRLCDERDDILWEKSREMGATWMALIAFDWLSLFHRNKKFLCISHSEHAVDRAADPDSLFWKIRFMHDRLPEWITRGVKTRKMGFDFPHTQSSINGAASTGRSGVGGRATAVMLDEFSKQREAREINAQTADTGPRLFIGTHYELASEFHLLTQRPDMKKIVMHWTQHPEKWKGAYRYDEEKNRIEVLDTDYDYPVDYQFERTAKPVGGPFPGVRSVYYDRECTRRANDRDVAIHLDISPTESQWNFFDTMTIRVLRAQYATPPLWEGELDFDYDSCKPIALIPRAGGLVKMWLRPLHDGTMPAGRYFAGADISSGMGATPSCFTVADHLGNKVVEYATAMVSPEDFAPVTVSLCRLFAREDGTPAEFAWEESGPGSVFRKHVLSTGFNNYYCRESHTTYGTTPRSKIAGWYPSPKAKLELLTDYRSALYKRWFVNPSDKALEECTQFRYTADGMVEHSSENTTSTPTDARDNHGDRTIADALCSMLVTKSRRDAEVKKEPAQVINSLAYRRGLRQNQPQQWI